VLAAVGVAYNAAMLNVSSCRAWAAPGRSVLAGAAAWLLVGRAALAAPAAPAQPVAAQPAPEPAASPSLTGVPADLKRDEIRCAGEACAIGACLLQELSRDPDRLLRAARIVPVAAQDKVHGFRLFGLRPGSLLARLGIVNGDVVLALSGQPLTTPDQALAALGALRSADSVLLGLEREGRPLARRVLFDRRPLRDDKCPKPAPSADSDGRPQPVSLKRPDPGPQEALRRITKDLRCQGDRCTLHRSTVDEILGHSELFAQSARLIPVFKKGARRASRCWACDRARCSRCSACATATRCARSTASI
jgi:general secretion pathway protein C